MMRHTCHAKFSDAGSVVGKNNYLLINLCAVFGAAQVGS